MYGYELLMILDRLRRYAVEPLYHNMCYTDRPEVVIPYALAESEKRILRILSIGQERELYARMEAFPWREMEELLGEHMYHAIRVADKRKEIGVSMNIEYSPSIFDMYKQYTRMDYDYLR